MDVCGEALQIGRSHLITLASRAGLKKDEAVAVLDQVCEAAEHVPHAAQNMPIELSTWRHISTKVEQSRKRVGTQA